MTSKFGDVMQEGESQMEYMFSVLDETNNNDFCVYFMTEDAKAWEHYNELLAKYSAKPGKWIVRMLVWKRTIINGKGVNQDLGEVRNTVGVF